MSTFIFEKSWVDLLQDEVEKPYMRQLFHFLKEERRNYSVWPKEEDVFNALTLCPLDTVKVVIVGQDPYHGFQQAHGLSFSVPDKVAPPPSLKNIFKELEADLGIVKKEGNLIQWAKQGVLLLNSILTVRQGEPLSHEGRGWERFTDALLEKLALQDRPLVFLLWGKYAKDKIASIGLQERQGHLIVTAPHPSPFSAHRGFLGCRHFSKANSFIENKGLKPINFSL